MVLLVQIVFIGWTMDTLLALNHLISFSDSFPPPLNFIQPFWLTCLWMSLAVTINQSLLWLQKLGSWCTVFGLFFGTLSYLAGERFQVLHFESLQAVEITAVCWAALIPLCLMLGKYQMIKVQKNV
jgi:ABC-type amino acid transport substrate-binding protein